MGDTYKKMKFVRPFSYFKRIEEWATDVPTIGCIYDMAHKVACYFNGLGKALKLDSDTLSSPHHWMKRAWTLQEYRADLHILGLPEAHPGHEPDWEITLDTFLKQRLDGFPPCVALALLSQGWGRVEDPAERLGLLAA